MAEKEASQRMKDAIDEGEKGVKQQGRCQDGPLRGGPDAAKGSQQQAQVEAR
jgi:hypothetical protein